ncbi:hypothetical protein GMOD_00001174 [Pyrenophora seminiperda CCB06]|uniref:Uncharacterized protein n=1 Tax=Pyrenophora seminiperda CCB06 TaxID=1302712 RepID=A0A3M7LYL3_9PLEO|nr:hypothetical protein GMOD_00001174 [Pyrenophora seminiperda CCB06]
MLKHPPSSTATIAPTDRSYQQAIIRVTTVVPARCKIYENAVAAPCVSLKRRGGCTYLPLLLFERV